MGPWEKPAEPVWQRNSTWIETEHSHRRVVNTDKLDTIYVNYKGWGKWAVIGTMGNMDILIRTYPTEKEANDAVDALLRSLL